uniref:Uncharacterized protein n=1 Tax=Arundo donax TaxID=35708 RepID=A0A0A9EHP8_ARUDO
MLFSVLIYGQLHCLTGCTIRILPECDSTFRESEQNICSTCETRNKILGK